MNNLPAEKLLERLFRLQYDMANMNHDMSQHYIVLVSIEMAEIRQKLRNMRVSEYDYKDMAMRLYKEWDEDESRIID